MLRAGFILGDFRHPRAALGVPVTFPLPFFRFRQIVPGGPQIVLLGELLDRERIIGPFAFVVREFPLVRGIFQRRNELAVHEFAHRLEQRFVVASQVLMVERDLAVLEGDLDRFRRKFGPPLNCVYCFTSFVLATPTLPFFSVKCFRTGSGKSAKLPAAPRCEAAAVRTDACWQSRPARADNRASVLPRRLVAFSRPRSAWAADNP